VHETGDASPAPADLDRNLDATLVGDRGMITSARIATLGQLNNAGAGFGLCPSSDRRAPASPLARWT
jgi:hypothetical protein